MSDTTIRIAVDIGGTFTDIQVLDQLTGKLHDFKARTTPDDPSVGLIDAIEGAAARYGFDIGRIGMILHGSTIATNAVLERKLPQGALITTLGFSDVLEIGRHMRRNVYSLRAEPRSLLIARHRRFGVAGRMRSDGSVEQPLDTKAVRRIGHQLADQGIATVAIMFLHAYRNPEHEQQAAAILAGIEGLSVATSHETSPEIREFERASTTVLNALLKPVISAYLARLEQRLTHAGINARLLLVQSNGGVATAEETARLPVKLLLSGPAGGAMAMVKLASRHELVDMVGIDMVGIDMGGTSSDVSVVQHGQIQETAMGEIDGLPIRMPMVEIRVIGAGGGSIARVDAGALRVGPQSAGAHPGPACYGAGGTAPTVTDANLHLGLIDPQAFLGGTMSLDPAAAGAAVAGIAGGLGLAVDQAAAGIVQVANTSMAGAIRLSLFERGANPSDFVLVPFGGAGGLHACAIAEELEIARILFPGTASTLSARGILTSNLRHDLSHSELLLADDAAVSSLARIIALLRDQATRMLDRDGVPPEDRRIEMSADMRYRGQAYEINTPWTSQVDGMEVDGQGLAGLIAAFHDLHRTRYAHNAPGEPVEIVTVRARAIGLLEQPDLRSDADTTSHQPAGQRQVCLSGAWQTVPVHRRAAIGSAVLNGPLVVEEEYSVLLIAAGWSVRAVGHGDLIAEYEKEVGA